MLQRAMAEDLEKVNEELGKLHAEFGFEAGKWNVGCHDAIVGERIRDRFGKKRLYPKTWLLDSSLVQAIWL